MKHTLATLVIGLSLLMGKMSGAWALDVQKALTAFRSGNFKTALQEWRPLAEHGNADAQSILGLMHYGGEGVTQDYKEAMKWFLLAAEQGTHDAQYNLGLMYSNGLGVTQDYKEASKWYQLAVEEGHAAAQLNLGVAYALGNGVAQDYVKAHMWSNIAAANGEANGSELRDITAKRMTAADINKAQQLARECVAKNYKGC